MRLSILLPALALACTSGAPDAGKPTDGTGDGGDSSDTDPGPDSGDSGPPPDTGRPPVTPPDGYTGPARLAVVITDDTTGNPAADARVVLVDPDGGAATAVTGVTVRADSVAACGSAAIFLLESQQSNDEEDRVVGIAAEDGSVLADWTIGAMHGPTDAAFASERYWFSLAGKPRLVSYDDDGVAAATVELRDWSDDGFPEGEGVLPHAGQLYALLSDYSPGTDSYGTARLVQVDPATAAVTGSADLAGRAPSGRMVASGSSLYVHHAPTLRGGAVQADGGIEKIDVGTLASGGLVVDFSADGLKQVAVSLEGDGAWVAYADGDNLNWIGRWQLSGAAQQRWPAHARVVGLSGDDEGVWVAENPYDGSDGSLVRRASADGAEEARVALDGRIASLRACTPTGAAPATPPPGADARRAPG